MENYNLESARELINSAEKELSKEFEKAEEICEFNSEKVLKAFQENRVNEADFGSTTGYGYGDIGREKIEKVFADVLKAEDCIVRGQFISGTHALTVALFAFLRPGDTMLSINGKPYDTLDEVIGIAENPSSLKSFGVKYEQIDLINDDFDYEKITERLKQMAKVAVEALKEKKGYDVKVIDISEISILADFFIIANGSNANQVQAMVDNVEEQMYKAGFDDPKVEGYNNASWILLDYNDVVLHIFDEESRSFYNLERLWRDGKEVDVDTL